MLWSVLGSANHRLLMSRAVPILLVLTLPWRRSLSFPPKKFSRTRIQAGSCVANTTKSRSFLQIVSEIWNSCSTNAPIYRLWIKWGWINDDSTFIFGWAIPLKNYTHKMRNAFWSFCGKNFSASHMFMFCLASSISFLISGVMLKQSFWGIRRGTIGVRTISEFLLNKYNKNYNSTNCFGNKQS